MQMNYIKIVSGVLKTQDAKKLQYRYDLTRFFSSRRVSSGSLQSQ